MKKLIALALVALVTAACDAGIAGSQTVTGPGSGPAACPVGKAASASGDCGNCPSADMAADHAATKADCKDGSCDAPPMDCETKCDEAAKKDCQTKCEEAKKECAPKGGN